MLFERCAAARFGSQSTPGGDQRARGVAAAAILPMTPRLHGSQQASSTLPGAAAVPATRKVKNDATHQHRESSLCVLKFSCGERQRGPLNKTLDSVSNCQTAAQRNHLQPNFGFYCQHEASSNGLQRVQRPFLHASATRARAKRAAARGGRRWRMWWCILLLWLMVWQWCGAAGAFVGAHLRLLSDSRGVTARIQIA